MLRILLLCSIVVLSFIGCEEVNVGVKATPETATVSIGEEVTVKAEIDNPMGLDVSVYRWRVTIDGEKSVTVVLDGKSDLQDYGIDYRFNDDQTELTVAHSQTGIYLYEVEIAVNGFARNYGIADSEVTVVGEQIG